MDALLEQARPRSTSSGCSRRRRLDSWVFMSDVCKHCTHAGCLDACPTGALIRTEFETVILQPDVCNGCGYCVPSCPFGVIDRDHDDGRAAKCTLCYDRLEDGLEPACAKACPTDSIQFGPYDELVDIAARRVAALHERGVDGAYLYGAGDDAGEVAGGLGAFFLLTEPPEVYGLPAQAESPIQENVVPATLAAMGAGLLAAAGVAAAFVAGGRAAEARWQRWRRRGGRARRLRAAARARARRRSAASPRARTRRRLDGARDDARARHAGGRRRGAATARRSRCTSASGATGAGRTSTTTTRTTRAAVGRRRADARAARATRSRRRHRAGHPRAGVDVGGAALLLVRRHGGGVVVRRAGLRPGGRREVGARSRGGSRSARSCPRRSLLIMDLGRPARFLNMLRIFKPRSPMSMGAWCLVGVLARSRPAAVGARPARRAGARRSALGARERGRRRLPRLVHRRAARRRPRCRCGRARGSSSARSSCRTATATGAAATRLALVAAGPARGPPDARRARPRRDRRDGRRAAAVSTFNERRLGDARRPASSDGQPGSMFRAAKWLVRAGLALRFVARAHRPPGARRGERPLPARRAAVPLRVGRRGPAQSARDDEVVAEMARERTSATRAPGPRRSARAQPVVEGLIGAAPERLLGAAVAVGAPPSPSKRLARARASRGLVARLRARPASSRP